MQRPLRAMGHLSLSTRIVLAPCVTDSSIYSLRLIGLHVSASASARWKAQRVRSVATDSAAAAAAPVQHAMPSACHSLMQLYVCSPQLPFSLPLGWREWKGLLISDSGPDRSDGRSSDSESPENEGEAALSIWMLFARGDKQGAMRGSILSSHAAAPLQLETGFTILQQYTISAGSLDAPKQSVHFTQSCLPAAQASCPWSSREFTATLAVAAHDEDSHRVKYTMEGKMTTSARIQHMQPPACSECSV